MQYLRCILPIPGTPPKAATTILKTLRSGSSKPIELLTRYVDAIYLFLFSFSPSPSSKDPMLLLTLKREKI
jgi:hypothetical protein